MSRCCGFVAPPAQLWLLLLSLLVCAGGAMAGLSFDVSPPKSSSSSSQFSIGSALRYLSKAIFIDALVGGELRRSYKPFYVH